MYTLTIKNNYIYDIQASNGVKISKENTHIFDNQGSMFIRVPGMGEINFIDLGENKINGYSFPTATWGVLVRSHTTEAHYRYEGGGELTAIIDHQGTTRLSTKNGEILNIRLPELTIN